MPAAIFGLFFTHETKRWPRAGAVDNLSARETRTATLTLQSESIANWEADEKKWTVPINILVSKLSSFGVFRASYQIGFGGFVAHPAIGPSWKIRGAIVILLPRRN